MNYYFGFSDRYSNEERLNSDDNKSKVNNDYRLGVILFTTESLNSFTDESLKIIYK